MLQLTKASDMPEVLLNVSCHHLHMLAEAYKLVRQSACSVLYASTQLPLSLYICSAKHMHARRKVTCMFTFKLFDSLALSADHLSVLGQLVHSRPASQAKLYCVHVLTLEGYSGQIRC